MDHLTITWAFTAGSFKHIDIEEKGNYSINTWMSHVFIALLNHPLLNYNTRIKSRNLCRLMTIINPNMNPLIPIRD